MKSIWDNYQAPRNEYFPAYIVFSEAWRDLHRHVIFLSPEHGLLSAFLYGAVSKRNPLRATAQSYSFGQLRLKQGRKAQIADWQLESPSLILQTPDCAEVYQHVALWSELLLYAHGPAQLFAELRSLLSSLLHFDSESHCHLASLRFLWQFLLLEGFQPGLAQCHNCEQDLHLEIFFSARSELLCNRCARGRSGHFLNSGEWDLLRWAEQDLKSFVRQNELFFGSQSDYCGQLALRLLGRMQSGLEQLLGRSLRSRLL